MNSKLDMLISCLLPTYGYPFPNYTAAHMEGDDHTPPTSHTAPQFNEGCVHKQVEGSNTSTDQEQSRWKFGDSQHSLGESCVACCETLPVTHFCGATQLCHTCSKLPENIRKKVAADDSSRALPVNPVEKWSAEKIEDWVRATARLANQAAKRELDKGRCDKECLDARSVVVRQRWQSAKAHIPKSLHGGLQQILHEF